MRLGKIRKWWQDDDFYDDKGVNACKYFEDLVRCYTSLEQIPVNQEILSEADDTFVSHAPCTLQTPILTI